MSAEPKRFGPFVVVSSAKDALDGGVTRDGVKLRACVVERLGDRWTLESLNEALALEDRWGPITAHWVNIATNTEVGQ